MKKFFILLLIGALYTGFALAQDTSTDSSSDTSTAETAVQGDTVLDMIANTPDLSTLYSAIQAAGLEATLSSEGSLTVFAPTNAAFDALPAGELDALLADPAQLSAVLLNHVSTAEYRAADVQSVPAIMTAQGAEVPVTVDAAGAVTVGNAALVEADLMASNGVVHVIDTVLLPSADAMGQDATMEDASSDDASMDDTTEESGEDSN